MTRKVGEVRLAREYYEEGLSVSEVARQVGIPRSTVRDWVRDGFTERLLARGPSPLEQPCDPCEAALNLKEESYSYLLGLYLGDGCISRHPRTYMFSNRSADIRAIFALACERAGVECKRTNEWLTAVSRREHVALMDSFIGPKY
jgi:hypothetical protein